MALTALKPESGNEFVDSFINNGRHYVNDPGVSGPFTINYFFGELAGTTVDGRNYGYTWRPFEKNAFRTASTTLEAVANIDFVEVDTQAAALFVERLQNQVTAGGTVSASHNLPSSNPAAQSFGTYNFEAVNVRQWSPDMLERGGNFFRTFIHELGHGLGLKHPHDSGSGAFSPNYFPGIDPTDTSAERQRSLGALELNHMFGSVMSYLHGYEFDEQGRVDVVPTRQRPVAEDFFLDHGFAATPMAYDIAALQYLYGANTTTNNGDNVYVMPDSNDPRPFVRGEPNEVGVPESIVYQPDTAFWSCIWDTGGTDEMRYDGTRNAILDLTAATLDLSTTSYGVLSHAAGIGGGYTIANGVVVENATGGQGNDQITGNAAVNVLLGRGGNDTIAGGAGGDTLDGGLGADIFIDTAANLDGDTIVGFGISDSLVVRSGVVANVSLVDEVLSFTVDGTAVTLTLDGPDGPDAPVRVVQNADGTTTISFSSNQALFGAVTTDPASLGGQVYTLVDGLFGRDATPLEIEQGVRALSAGATLEALATSYLATPEGQALYGGADDAGFVARLYQTALNRAPDEGGSAGWTGLLANGASRGAVAVGVAASAENVAGVPELASGIFVPDAEASTVARLYYALLDRAPDAAGLQGWTTFLESGGSAIALANNFLGSAEYAGRFGSLTNDAFVDSLYENALGRTPDADGEAFFNGQLSNGTSRADIATQIALSPEAERFLANNIEGSFFVV